MVQVPVKALSCLPLRRQRSVLKDACMGRVFRSWMCDDEFWWLLARSSKRGQVDLYM